MWKLLFGQWINSSFFCIVSFFVRKAQWEIWRMRVICSAPSPPFHSSNKQQFNTNKSLWETFLLTHHQSSILSVSIKFPIYLSYPNPFLNFLCSLPQAFLLAQLTNYILLHTAVRCRFNFVGHLFWQREVGQLLQLEGGGLIKTAKAIKDEARVDELGKSKTRRGMLD